MYLFSKRSYKDFLDVVTTLLSMDVIFLEPEKKTAFLGLPEIIFLGYPISLIHLKHIDHFLILKCQLHIH